MELLIAVGVFGLISGVVYFIVASRAPVSDEVIQRRLENINVKAESSHQFRLHEADETYDLGVRLPIFSWATRSCRSASML